MNPKRLRGGLVIILLFFSILSSRAEIKGKTSETSTEAALFLLGPLDMSDDITLGAVYELGVGPLVDGDHLCFRYYMRHDLAYRSEEQAEFVSAIWKDASGTPLNQRSVFMIKGDLV